MLVHIFSQSLSRQRGKFDLCGILLANNGATEVVAPASFRVRVVVEATVGCATFSRGARARIDTFVVSPAVPLWCHNG